MESSTTELISNTGGSTNLQTHMVNMILIRSTYILVFLYVYNFNMLFDLKK